MANLTRFDPFSVSSLDPFDDVFKGFFRPVSLERNAQQALKVDVHEDEQNYTLHAELPGVSKEDIHVTIDGNHVSISAETRRESEAKEGSRVLRSERYYGKVSRSFVLDKEVDDSKAEAHYKDGILQLVLPKKQIAAAKKLAIN